MTDFRFIIFLLSTFLLTSCAIQVPPGGGEKDVQPPKLISCEPPNFSTSFTGHDIRLNFDEYISLNDITSQLIISPLLKNSPEVRIRKKSVLIHINDTLKDNTTYTINFGQSIADNNEGNKLENFQYVFSTGEVIDSATISGKIKFAFDLKTEKGLLAALYKDMNDSLPFLERPLYFARTNDSGDFSIRNIAPGEYKIIGLKETDGNYLYIPGEEWIAFTELPIKANTNNVNLNLFNEPPRLRLIKAYSEFAGKAVLAFNATADTLPFKFITDTSKLKLYSTSFSKNKDSLTIWYENINADSLSIKFESPSIQDTVVIRLFKGAIESRGKKSLSFILSAGDQQTTLQHLYLPFFIKCNHPVVSADFSKVILLQDSQRVNAEFEFVDSLHMNIQVNFPWKSKSKYSMVIPSSIIKDFYGLYNDSMEFTFTARSETDYGSMKLNFRVNEPAPYLVQLTDEYGSTVFSGFTTENDTVYEFKNLEPRNYKIKIVRDKNRNAKWDSGNYLRHIQPEKADFYSEKITVRANWDVDVIVNAVFSEK